MINGDPYEFLEMVSNAQEILYLYKGVRYFYQGYTKNDGFHMEVFKYDAVNEGFVLNETTDYYHMIEIFENAPIFEGKTFWEVEKEIEWLDDWTVDES